MGLESALTHRFPTNIKCLIFFSLFENTHMSSLSKDLILPLFPLNTLRYLKESAAKPDQDLNMPVFVFY